MTNTIKLPVKTADLVDGLGILRAKLAPLLLEEAAYEARLKARGAGGYEGEFYHVNVADCAKVTVDKTALAAKLESYMKPGLFARFMKSITSSSPYLRLTVTAKLKEQKAA